MPRCQILRAAVVVAACAVATLALAPAASAAASTVVTGRVSGDGLPLQHVSVSVVVVRSGLGVDTYATAETKKDGTFRLVVPGSAPDKAWVQYRAGTAVGGTSPTGYADKCAAGGPICVDDDHPTLRLNGTARVANAALGRAGVLRGRVTDSLGRGVGALPLSASAGVDAVQSDRLVPTVTDANGNYAFARLNPYDYEVHYGDPHLPATAASPAADGYTGRQLELSVKGGRTLVQDVTLVGGGRITGRVVDQNGAPFAGARVTWYLFVPLLGPTNTTTAADGSFTLRYLSARTEPLCVDAGASTTCPGSTRGVDTTVREFATTTVRIVMRRAS